MEKTTKTLEKIALLLEKYKKNKTLVSPEDLEGRYKVPFQKLKAELKEELEEYLKDYTLEQLELNTNFQEYLDKFADDVNQIFADAGIGKRIGRAVFKDFDLEQVRQLAEELRIKVYNEAWVPFFQKHICLYATKECLAEENPQKPRIYNSLVDKFWDEETREWIKDETAKKPTTMIYIQVD